MFAGMIALPSGQLAADESDQANPGAMNSISGVTSHRRVHLGQHVPYREGPCRRKVAGISAAGSAQQHGGPIARPNLLHVSARPDTWLRSPWQALEHLAAMGPASIVTRTAPSPPERAISRHRTRTPAGLHVHPWWSGQRAQRGGAVCAARS